MFARLLCTLFRGSARPLCSLAIAACLVVPNASDGSDRRPGFQPHVFALKHVKAVVEPGNTITDATLVIRDGVIEAVGPADEVDVPVDAEQIAGEGLTAYAGFLDAYSTSGIDKDAERSHTGSGRKVDYSSFALGATPPDNRSGLTPEFVVADALVLDDDGAAGRRKIGFTTAIVAPSGGIATGQSALVSLSGLPRREILIRSPIALHVALRSTGSRGYPSTLMGFVSHLRQAMLDADHNDTLWQYFHEHGGRRPPNDPALVALASVKRGEIPVFWAADSRDEIHRALDLATEFGVEPVIVGGREAWKVADRLKAENVPVVLRINFPEKPKKGVAGAELSGMERRFLAMSLEEVKDLAKRTDLPSSIRSRVEARIAELESPDKQEAKKEDEDAGRKLPESARILAEETRLWKEKVACAAMLAKAGVPFCFSTDGQKKPDEFVKNLRAAIDEGLSPDDALAALTTQPARLLGVEDRFGRLANGFAAHVAVFDGPFHEKKSKLRYVFVDSEKFELNAPKQSAEDKEKDSSDKESADAKEEEAPEEEKSSKPEERKEDKLVDDEPAGEPFPTEIEADRKPSFQTGGNVAIRGATVLTVTQGTLEEATIVVQDGKIAAIGTDVDIPDGIHVVEAKGLYVMPGIIDTHSHCAISGGVNEATLSVVPEVRIKDVVDADDLTIYRALAGGVTVARLLHGSANPIGGQDAVVKFRWGRPARELIIDEGPRGVKFALGENPKRSSTRYPDTRLGVESTIRRAFEEGRMYGRLWQSYRSASTGNGGPPPRRDLRLEALADITSGELRIHCHCYRADEILMLMRMAESYGIRIASLQHVLEGYKVAAEIAAHGASNSTFADWWAYKIEAYDAIPYNAALLVEAGAHVALKSDDQELMRHLYQDAAKMVRYGGLEQDEVLAMITINAAEQLGLGHRIGSIEVGKDADLAVFNGHPLGGFARCEMTFVDGEIYFERHGDHQPSGYGSPIPADELRLRSVTIDESPEGQYVLTNARIVPVTGQVIESGTLIISDGKIAAIAGTDLPVPEPAVTVDLAGLSVYPGMINAGDTLGLVEIGSAQETHDYNERGDYNEDVRASIAVNPDSELIPVSRTNGILTVLTQPSGGVISGQSVLMNLLGWIPPEMSVVDPMALHVNFPAGSITEGSSDRAATRKKEATEAITALKERFQLAIRHERIISEEESSGAGASVPDPQLLALAPYAKGQRPVIIHASGHGDILAAIDFADELRLKWILADAGDAWKCVDELKKHNVPVILGPSMRLPEGRYEPYDAPYANAATLHKAGVTFAIKATDAGPGRATSTRNLPFQAAMAVAYGLPELEGLKAVTIYPAQILGVDDRLGSIEIGKIANLVITDGHLLQPATSVKGLFIAGRPVPPTNKHTRLYARYRQRLEQVRTGKVPLGVGSEDSTGGGGR